MKKLQNLIASALAALMFAGVAIAPVNADAQTQAELKRRQQKKNEWRNLAIGAGAVGLFGLLKGDNTLMFAGTAGALYSLHRYEQDRKSQSRMQRARAQMFSKKSFVRDGYVYKRKLVTKNGKKYYQFVRAGRV